MQLFGCERGNSLPGDEMKMTEQQGERPIKILITKIGFDGHDRGNRIVAVFLRDAGMEVAYIDPWQPVSKVVNLEMKKDVDVVGTSILATDQRARSWRRCASEKSGNSGRFPTSCWSTRAATRWHKKPCLSLNAC